MDTFIVVLVFLLSGIFVLRPQLRQKKKKEFGFNLAVFIIGFVLLLLVSLEIPLPNITTAIQNAIYKTFPFIAEI